MGKDIELDTFGQLLESVDSYSKIIEIATELDESFQEFTKDSCESFASYNSLPTESDLVGYGNVIKELRKTECEPSEFDASILVETSTDELEGNDTEYVSVCLTNNNYNESIVIQPEINFDDYRKYKTFGMDFVPWSQLLNKTIRVTTKVLNHKPEEYTIEEFALGHILWEITFYGFSSERIEQVHDDIDQISKKSIGDLKVMLEEDLNTDRKLSSDE